jgi:hypothetical protein
MGEPIISSRYWKIDVFRVTEKQYEGIVLFLPFPIPMLQSDVVHRYTIVSYDQADLVDEVKSGLYREKSFNHTHHSSYLNLELQIGKYQLRIDGKDDQVIILADPELLNTCISLLKNEDKCLVIVGCKFAGVMEEPDICRTDFSFDGGAMFYLPARPHGATSLTRMEMTKNVGRYIQFQTPIEIYQLPSGEHRLNVSTSYSYFEGESSAAFNCQKNELLSIVINPTRNISSPKVQWSFDYKREITEIFLDRKIVLYAESMWLVDSGVDN